MEAAGEGTDSTVGPAGVQAGAGEEAPLMPHQGTQLSPSRWRGYGGGAVPAAKA